MMDDQSLLRYSRQIMLPEVDIAGQERLRNGHALIVGAGGLGSPSDFSWSEPRPNGVSRRSSRSITRQWAERRSG